MERGRLFATARKKKPLRAVVLGGIALQPRSQEAFVKSSVE